MPFETRFFPFRMGNWPRKNSFLFMSLIKIMMVWSVTMKLVFIYLDMIVMTKKTFWTLDGSWWSIYFQSLKRRMIGNSTNLLGLHLKKFQKQVGNKVIINFRLHHFTFSDLSMHHVYFWVLSSWLLFSALNFPLITWKIFY